MGQDSEQTGDRTCAEEYRVQGTEDRTGSRGVYTVEQGSKGQGIRKYTGQGTGRRGHNWEWGRRVYCRIENRR